MNVVRGSGLTRDAWVEFADGRRITDRQDREEPRRRNEDRIRLDAPRRDQTVAPGRVEFRGTAPDRQRVTVTVRDERGRDIERGSTKASSTGRWDVTIRLREGEYRAEASGARGTEGDTVRFQVRRQAGGRNDHYDRPGGPRRGVVIERPRNGAIEPDAFVRASGYSDSDRVIVTVYRGGRRVSRSEQRVFGRRWSAGPRLDPGSYRMVVEAAPTLPSPGTGEGRAGARGRDEVSFVVR